MSDDKIYNHITKLIELEVSDDLIVGAIREGIGEYRRSGNDDVPLDEYITRRLKDLESEQS